MERGTDLRDLLKQWPYDPDNNARLVGGDDGRPILQVRLPLGIEQYELDGRPDGERPRGKESALEHYLARLLAAQARGAEDSFSLNHEECEELFSESTLYYYRYLNLFQIKDWARTERDTARNLRVFDLVHRYADAEEDQFYLEQWRPYVIRMNAIAAAMLELEQDHHSQALGKIHDAILKIEALPEMDDETFQFERQRSLSALREMAEQINQTKPVSELESLERELHSAIEVQHFEKAAELRDRIRALRGTAPQKPST
jgi:hypothetical protein